MYYDALEEIEGNIPSGNVYKIYTDSYTIGKNGMNFYSHTFRIEGGIIAGIIHSTISNGSVECVFCRNPYTEEIYNVLTGSQPDIRCAINKNTGTVTIYRNHDYDDIPGNTTFTLYTYYE